MKIDRRHLLKGSAAIGVASAMPLLRVSKLFHSGGAVQAANGADKNESGGNRNPLSPPAHGGIPVAFVLSQDAVVIDFAGPWEVFNNVHMSGSEPMPFHTYTVAETLNPIVASGGMKIMPNYTFQSAPPPKVIVIPAQGGTTEAMLAWIRKASKTTDVTMSVCTGAFVLAKTGLLSGKSATTFHGAFADFEKDYPDIHLKRGARFVEEGNLATAGGLSSGIDLAIRVVERYFGRHTAEQTAYTLEYQGKGWTDPNSNEIYAKPLTLVAADGHPLCPVCGMDGDASISSAYKGKSYYFCMQAHKESFDDAPEKFISAAKI
jgi:putative intracellular protease/amidase/YHS domain-containing protein